MYKEQDKHIDGLMDKWTDKQTDMTPLQSDWGDRRDKIHKYAHNYVFVISIDLRGGFL